MSQTLDLRAPTITLLSERGDTVTMAVVLWQDKAHTVPQDLTLATAITMQVKKERNGPVKATLTVGSGLTITGDDNNRLAITLASTLLPSKYVADLQLEFPGSVVRTYFKIDWTIFNDVTR